MPTAETHNGWDILVCSLKTEDYSVNTLVAGLHQGVANPMIKIPAKSKSKFGWQLFLVTDYDKQVYNYEACKKAMTPAQWDHVCAFTALV